jgi:hypothetical protein
VLNSYTRWGYGEMMEMDVEELVDWMEKIRDVYSRK